MPECNVVNGTSYHVQTPAAVIEVLERARQNRTRIHVSFGDAATGLDWLEEWDITGYVGRSMGPVKVPLLIANRRSLGGGAILDHCIVRIRESAGGRILYQHPAYHFGTLAIAHFVTEATDNSRDFQDYLLELAVKLARSKRPERSKKVSA